MPTDTDRILALEDRVAVLEEALGIRYEGMKEWGLSPVQAQIVGILRKIDSAPCKRIYVAIYGSALDPPDLNVVRVHISHLRSKLKPHGVEIKSGRGCTSCGYWIPEEQKRLLDA